uniref:Uncharacterized protein n=1 Tax=Anguilla anguilla TaxID=7936 RepID=A0A0E9TRI5_ANGAN
MVSMCSQKNNTTPLFSKMKKLCNAHTSLKNCIVLYNTQTHRA